MRVGLLGIAHVHTDAYVVALRAEGAEVVGLVDRDPVRARSWGQKHSVPVFDSVEQLCAAGLDGVIVCAETAFHLELVVAAAEAGLAILCEKPLGISVDESRAIVEVCERNSARLVTAFPARFDPSVRRVQELASSGALGAVRAISGTNQSVMPMRERSWFADPVLAGGGAMMDHIVHLADLYSWILGAEPETVFAVSNRVMHSDVVTVETSGLVLLSYPDGAFASIDCSWNRPLNFPTWGGLALSVFGDEGRAEAEPGLQRLTRFGGSSPYSWVPWGTDSNAGMIRNFLSPDARGEEASGMDGHRATRIALAALESARSGEVVVMQEF